MPDCKDSTVFFPMTRGGLVSSTLSNCAARRDSASTDISIPGASAPPTNSPRAHRVKVCRGAEIHDYRRAAVKVDRRERVHDPVAAHFLGVVGPHRDARLYPRLDDDRFQVTVIALAHLSHLTQHRRHG